MKVNFKAAVATPFRACELCLEPMKFLEEHGDSWLFRCDECALVSTQPAEAMLSRQTEFATKRPSMWR
jgi:predicted  nucleic acid-binding Zn ribbon protein